MSFLFWGGVGALFLGAFVVDLPLWLVSQVVDPRLRLVHRVNMLVGRTIVRINPLWRVRVVGPNRLPAGVYVLCINHQSNADVFCMAYVRGQYRYLGKQSLLRIPVVGWVMTLGGHIPVKRGERVSGAEALARCRRWLDRGISVGFFPEGTRSETGELGPFKMGAFALAAEAGVPILPIVIDGTRTALPKHGLILRERADVLVRVLEPLPVGNDPEVLRDRTREALARGLEELRESRLNQ